MCSDTVIGVNCSCYDGYQLVDSQNCSGKSTSTANCIYVATYIANSS